MPTAERSLPLVTVGSELTLLLLLRFGLLHFELSATVVSSVEVAVVSSVEVTLGWLTTASVVAVFD